jgi:hypothetical protein
MSLLTLSRARRGATVGAFAALAIALASCDRNPSAPGAPDFAARNRPSDPTATWRIPLADGALALRSDGLFSDGTNSVYADGVCTVSAKIFATTAYSNSGDATIQTDLPRGNKCGRLFTYRLPDNTTESVAAFNNLLQLQNTTYSIPVGTTVARRLLLGGSVRCGRLMFGPNGTVSPGTDSVLVTRVDASTWQVASQAAPNDRALCENTGEIYEMPVSFTVESSTPLP